MPTPISAMKFIKNKEGYLEMVIDPPETAEQYTKRKATISLCNRIKQQLLRDRSLSGSLLEFALSIVEKDEGLSEPESKNDAVLNSIAAKLKAGQALDEYESHVMIDVLLLHVKLAA